jgi:nitroreductase
MMDAYDCIVTKLDVREFDPTRQVSRDVKLKILEAARLTGSAMNSQHWRFLLVQGQDRLKVLANDSTTGKWVQAANLAVMVLTEEEHSFQLIDVGRVVQDKQIAAWNYGVASCIFTGVDKAALQRDFAIPQNLNASAVVGFGYPAKKISGRKKNRKLIPELVSVDKFGQRFE